MIEAAMIWNEPNNKSHWDPELDPDWSRFARCVTLAGQAIQAATRQPAATRSMTSSAAPTAQAVRVQDA